MVPGGVTTGVTVGIYGSPISRAWDWLILLPLAQADLESGQRGAHGQSHSRTVLQRRASGGTLPTFGTPRRSQCMSNSDADVPDVKWTPRVAAPPSNLGALLECILQLRVAIVD